MIHLFIFQKKKKKKKSIFLFFLLRNCFKLLSEKLFFSHLLVATTHSLTRLQNTFKLVFDDAVEFLIKIPNFKNENLWKKIENIKHNLVVIYESFFNSPTVRPTFTTTTPSEIPSANPTFTRNPSLPPTIFTSMPSETPTLVTSSPSITPTSNPTVTLNPSITPTLGTINPTKHPTPTNYLDVILYNFTLVNETFTGGNQICTFSNYINSIICIQYTHYFHFTLFYY